MKLKIDWDTIQIIFDQDSDYNINGKDFLDVTTGDTIFILNEYTRYIENQSDKNEDDIDSLPEWAKEDILCLRKNPEKYLELEPPDHGQWHEAFQEWAKESNNPYYGSIGASLRDCDQDSRYGWYDFKFYKALEFGKEFLRKHGIDFIEED